MIPHPFDYSPYTADDPDDEMPDNVSDFLAYVVDNYVPTQLERDWMEAA